jgi:outer membrane protein OmpA-like peptidoglycan-associated protein/Tol biopolymer transport system component
MWIIIKRVSVVIFLIMISFAVFSQKGNEPMYSSTNKKAIKHFETGKYAYEYKRDKEALDHLKKAVELDPLFIEAHLMLGYVYVDARNPSAAIESFKKAIEIKPRFFPEMYFTLARVQLGIGLYEDAYSNYKKYLSFERINVKSEKMARQDVLNCEFALEAIKNPLPFNPQNLGPGINTNEHEYFPAITGDEKTLIFTRNRRDPESIKGTQEDFYISLYEKDTWKNAENIGPPINTTMNEGAPTLSADGNILIFTACDVYGEYGPNRKGYGSCDIFFSKRSGNKWSNPLNIGAPINTSKWESQPSFSADGKTLFFVSNRPGGLGESDIWFSVLKDDGSWSSPVNPGANVNSIGKEESVFIHPDGQTLYFSSDGRTGMGGLDIYMSQKNGKGEWGPALNLGYPINTFGDENSLLVGAGGRIAYFASDREGGFGGLDIYSFELPEKVRPQLVTYMKGKVFDSYTKKPLEAMFELIDLETGKVMVESFSNPGNGEFLVSLPANKNYALNVSKQDYLFYSENFSLKEPGSADKPTVKDIPLQPIRAGESVVLKNVFFNTGSAELKPESMVELDKLARFLEKNPKVFIEIGGHTDNVGDKKSNQVLSENRGKSVHEYLVSKKINPERLTFKGFGDTQPIAENSSPEGRQQNRRTEFKVISN